MAKELIFTGEMISAAEALRIGLVNRVVDSGQLMEEVKNTAKKMVAKGKVSVRAAKESINQGLNADLYTGLEIECNHFSLCMASEDAVEGTTAFLEKRKAEFKGGLK
jgi:enoyl-CoA hydratase